jgi:hypothetical protein
MNETGIQQRFHLMQKEIEAIATLSKDAKIDLTAAVDSTRNHENIYGAFPCRICRSLFKAQR